MMLNMHEVTGLEMFQYGFDISYMRNHGIGTIEMAHDTVDRLYSSYMTRKFLNNESIL